MNEIKFESDHIHNDNHMTFSRSEFSNHEENEQDD